MLRSAKHSENRLYEESLTLHWTTGESSGTRRIGLSANFATLETRPWSFQFPSSVAVGTTEERYITVGNCSSIFAYEIEPRLIFEFNADEETFSLLHPEHFPRRLEPGQFARIGVSYTRHTTERSRASLYLTSDEGGRFRRSVSALKIHEDAGEGDGG